MEKELLKGTIDIIILALISKRDMYGYEIAKKVKEKTNNFYNLGEGTLYPALKRLEDKNFIQSYWGDINEGNRRKYYRIVSYGRDELIHKLEYWNKINDLINQCLMEDDVNNEN